MTRKVSFSVSQVALVYPNSDPGMFWVAFYGCLLAEVIPVPIEVPLSKQVKMSLLLREFLCILISNLFINCIASVCVSNNPYRP